MEQTWADYIKNLHSRSSLNQSKQLDDAAYSVDAFEPDAGALNEIAEIRKQNLHIGKVINADSSNGVYLVAFNFPIASSGTICVDLTGNCVPFGVKTASRTTIGSTVLAYWDGQMTSFGYIFGSIPLDGTANDYIGTVFTNRISQISRTNESKNPLKKVLTDHLPMQYANDGKVSDAASLGDLTYSTLLGGLLHMDAFQIILQETERCSILLSVFNGLLRLTAQNYQLWTPASVSELFADRDFSHHFRGTSLYAWETLGMLTKPDGLESWTKDTGKSTGSESVREPKESMMPYLRLEELQGWLAQGIMRQVKSLPSGSKKFFVPAEFGEKVAGVFRESVHVDGTWMVDAAGGIFLRRRFNMPCYIKVKEAATEDKEKAEDKADKKTVEKLVQKEGAAYSTLQIEELVKREEEKALHAYAIGEESGAFKQAADIKEKKPIGIAELINKQFLKDSSGETAKTGIYGTDVKYCERDQLIAAANDGGMVIRDAFGNEIRTGPGGIEFISCADIAVRSGRRTVIMAGDDVILTANKSCDITAAQNDIRLAAYNNLEASSGLSGHGRLLLENNSTTKAVDTGSQVGEDVNTGGIVLAAKKSNICQYAGDIYTKASREIAEVGTHYAWYNSYNIAGKQSIKLVIDDPKDSKKVSNALEMTSYSVTTYGKFTANGQTFIDGSLFAGGSVTIDGGLRVAGSAIYTGSVSARNRQNGVVDADTGTDRVAWQFRE
jgi:hypothetical protein